MWVAPVQTPEPLILGRLFRLFTDRCHELRFPQSHLLDGCGRLVLFMCYLVSAKCPNDHGRVASSGDLRVILSRGSGRSHRVSASWPGGTSLEGCAHSAVRGLDLRSGWVRVPPLVTAVDRCHWHANGTRSVSASAGRGGGEWVSRA